MVKEFAVRTVFLSNYFEAASRLAAQRRSPDDPQSLINAMKRVDLADKTLEKELNGFVEKGYDITAVIPHPVDEGHPYDLLVTIVLGKETDD